MSRPAHHPKRGFWHNGCVSAEDQRFKEVARELARVAERRISEVLDSCEKSDLINLIGIIQERYSDLWQNNPTEALRQVIEDAADELPNEKIHEDATMVWRELAWGLYNLEANNLNHVDGRKYPHLVHETFVKAGIKNLPADTRRNITKRLRNKLAAELLDEPKRLEREKSALPRRVGNRVEGKLGDIPQRLGHYIRREQYHTRFRELVNNGEKLIVLVGQPGMGKSTLAHELIMEMAAEMVPVDTPVVKIRVESAGIDLSDLQAALSASKIDSSGIVIQDARAILAHLLCCDQAPQFVILDNLRSADELNNLLPLSTRSVVVATCRIEGSMPPANCQFMRVRKMRTTEAILMIRSRPPHLEEGDAEKLASKLHQYPLVMRHACGVLAQQDLSIDELLAADTGEFVAKVPVEVGKDLIAVLGYSLSLLRRRNELAFFMLAVITFLDLNPYVYEKALVRLVTVKMTDAPTATERLQCAQAIEVLHDFQLIDSERKGSLAIHPLTQEVLQSVLLDELLGDISNTAWSCIEQYASREKKISDADDVELRLAMTYCMNLIWNATVVVDEDSGFTPPPEFTERLVPFVAQRILTIHEIRLRVCSFGLNPSLVKWAEGRAV